MVRKIIFLCKKAMPKGELKLSLTFFLSDNVPDLHRYLPLGRNYFKVYGIFVFDMDIFILILLMY